MISDFCFGSFSFAFFSQFFNLGLCAFQECCGYLSLLTTIQTGRIINRKIQRESLKSKWITGNQIIFVVLSISRSCKNRTRIMCLNMHMRKICLNYLFIPSFIKQQNHKKVLKFRMILDITWNVLHQSLILMRKLHFIVINGSMALRKKQQGTLKTAPINKAPAICSKE